MPPMQTQRMVDGFRWTCPEKRSSPDIWRTVYYMRFSGFRIGVVYEK